MPHSRREGREERNGPWPHLSVSLRCAAYCVQLLIDSWTRKRDLVIRTASAIRGRIERPEVTQDEDGDSVTHLLLKDELLDAQLLRTVGSAPYGGADVGECLATAARVTGVDLTSWYEAWISTAETVAELAESELAAGRIETARLAFFRASNYVRTAGVVLMGAPADERLVAANTRQSDLFRHAAALLPRPPRLSRSLTRARRFRATSFASMKIPGRVPR